MNDPLQSLSRLGKVLVLALLSVALIHCDSGDGAVGPDDPPGDAGPFLRETTVGAVELTIRLAPGLNPPPTPYHAAVTLDLLARHVSSDDGLFVFRLRGFRLYRNGRLVRVADLPFNELQRIELPADQQVNLAGLGFSADEALLEGIDEGIYLVTLAFQVAEGPEIELLVGQVEFARNNGLTLGSEGTRRAVVSGRVTTSEGEPVPDARVDVELRWEDCSRGPFFLEIASTDRDGFYRVEAAFTDRVVDACATANVTPIFEFSRFSPARASARLDFGGSELRDEATIDVVLTR